jgi:DNA primase
MNDDRRDWIERARVVRIEDEIARRGLRLKRAGAAERVGPCLVCGGHDRFSINTRKQLWNCRHCGKGGDVIALVQHFDGRDFDNAITTLAGEISSQPANSRTDTAGQRPSTDYEAKQHHKAAWLWSQRRPITGSLAERYLRETRGYLGPMPSTLGFLPPSKPGRHPAMIAAFAPSWRN